MGKPLAACSSQRLSNEEVSKFRKALSDVSILTLLLRNSRIYAQIVVASLLRIAKKITVASSYPLTLPSPKGRGDSGTVIFFAILTAVSSVFGPGSVYSAPPTLKHLFPAGGQRGSKVVTTCTGEFSWPAKVWAPGIDVVSGKDEGKLEVSIPQDLAADRVWIRLYNEEGISAAAPFLIGNLKEFDEHEPNNSPRDAQVLAENSVTVNGVLQANGDVDAFAVSLDVGQTLVASVDANTRLGSPMDAILQVVSTDGFVLAENHDDVGLDPRLAFTATQPGTYIVRLFAFPASPNSTIAFRGEASFIYRLSLTTGPFITHSVPLSVSQADPVEVEVIGWNIPPNTRIPVVPFGEGTMLGDHQELDVLGPLRISPDARMGIAFAPHFGGAARVRLAAHPIVTALADPNPDNPLRLVPPIAVTGRLQIPREVDDFHVLLEEGQHVVISVESQSLNLPLAPVVRLIDPSGAVVSEVDNPPSKSSKLREAVITHVAAQDGDYRLTVGEQYLHGGERYLYILTVRFEEPDFELSASADSIAVSTEKPTEFELTVVRRESPNGSIGPITIEAVGLPPGVTAPAVVSEPTGPTAAKVSLKFSTVGDCFSGPIRIVGTASEPQEIKRVARTPARLATSLETIWLTALVK